MAGNTDETGQIEALIMRLAGAAICDSCIADRLNLPSPAQASAVTRAIGGQRGFERKKSLCALCGATRLTIRHSAK